MRPCGPVPWTCARSTPWAAATRCATGVTFSPSGVRIVSVSDFAGVGLSAPVRGDCLAGAAPLPEVIRAITWPTVTVSPASASTSVSVPEAGAGTSASTLSVEISTIVSSSATLSPGTSPTRGSCPRRPTRPSGASRSRSRCPEPASPFSGAASGSGSSAVIAGADPLVGAISASTLPTPTVSPSAAWILTTVPLTGAGTSASTLSVDISTSVSSSEISSPSCLCHSRMEPSETESPIGGMTTSTVVFTAISGS